jgi:peptidylprolyl isomerase
LFAIRHPLRRILVAVLAGSLALAGTLAVAAAGAPGAAASADSLSRVIVVGAAGKKPTLKFPKPFALQTSDHRVITTGTGEVVPQGAKITMDYVVVDGRTGKQLASTYSTTPVAAVLTATQTAGALVNSLVGANVGSRVLVGVSPSDGLTKGTSVKGVKKGDSLLFLIDVKSVRHPLARATGTGVEPPPGLPTVTLDPATGKPTITLPGTNPPSTMVVQALIAGNGPIVKKGQTVTVQYTGVIWGSGKQFDSSWDRGMPVDFPIGVGQVIPGWDAAIPGQTVGSQLLMIVPPADGYGSAGNSQAGITGTDTLVFVVDILDAY